MQFSLRCENEQLIGIGILSEESACMCSHDEEKYCLILSSK